MASAPRDFNLFHAAEERQADIAAYMQHWAQIAHWTQPVEKKKAEAAVNAAYELEDLNPPTLIYCESLWQMAAIAVCWSTTRDFQIVDECSELLEDESRRNLWLSLKQLIERQGIEKKLQSVGQFALEVDYKPQVFDLSKQLESKFKLRATELFFSIRREILPATMLGGLAKITAAYNEELVGEPQDFVFLHQDLLQNRVVADVLHDVMHLEARKVSSPAPLRDHRLDLDDWLMLLPNHRQFVLEMGYTVREIAQAIASALINSQPGRSASEVEQIQRSLIGALSVETDFKFWLSPWAVFQLPPYFYLIDQIEEKILPDAKCHELEVWRDLATAAFSYLFFPEVCLVCERPSVVAIDDRGRLHNEHGASVRFGDDYRQYFWHGRAVTRQIVEAPHTISIEQVEKESNAELKRIMIERYGMERFIADSNAVKLNEDEAGVLYRKELLNDEPLVVVKVRNSTPEPDGTYKDYFLRVPPRVRTAKEAVAWTFGMLPYEYFPMKET